MSVDAFASWQQIKTLTFASIKSRYRNTFAGLLWVVMSPLLMFGAQSYAFKLVLKLQFENYPLFLLTGLMPWIFFVQSVQMGTTSFVAQGRLLKSFPIHPFVCLSAMIADNLINFMLTFTLILLPFLIYAQNIHLLHFLLLPVAVFSLFIATVGVTLFLATLQVFFRDTRFIMDFVLSIAFYLTPIFYPKQYVSEKWYWLVSYNPFAILIAPIQSLSRDHLESDYFFSLSLSYFTALICFGIAVLYWRRKKNQVYFFL